MMSHRPQNYAKLPPQKLALLKSLLQKQKGTPLSLAKAASDKNDGSTVLSDGQHQLWFLDQLNLGRAAYNILSAICLSGKLEVAVLGQSLAWVLQRHEVLRAYFPAPHGIPVQQITPMLTISLPVVDLSELPVDEQAVQFHRLGLQAAEEPFDLAHGPLLRACLLRLQPQEHRLLWVVHHIIFDHWSLGIFLGELACCYDALRTGRVVPLPDLTVQYADYASWQQQHWHGSALEPQLHYWREQFHAAPAALNLPTDFARPAFQSFRGARFFFELDASLSLALKAVSQREGVTLFMTLLAGWSLLLARLSGQSDLVIGTDVANRYPEETEKLIGFFVNQLALRVKLPDNFGRLSFQSWLRQVREICLGAYTHQELPFSQLIQALNPKRHLDSSPLFQTKLVFLNVPLSPIHLSDLIFTPLQLQSTVAKFDLTLFMWEEGEELTGMLEYDTSLFRESTIKGWITSFEKLLQGIVKEPNNQLLSLLKNIRPERSPKMPERSNRGPLPNKQFKSIKPKAIEMPQDGLMKMSFLQPEQPFPLVIEPAFEATDLVGWLKSNMALIEAKLLEHGAILFRGFNMDKASAFERFALTMCPDLFKENGEHTPLTADGYLQVPVFYAPEKKLLWHNENSFNYSWPLKILFCCIQPADQGGETPIVDSRQVFSALSPKIRNRFMEKQIMYIRNYGAGLGVSWEQVFQTQNKAKVEEHCRASLTDFEWRENNQLRTKCVRLAVAKHPRTGALTWFNQAQHWHISCLDPLTRKSLLSLFKEDELPRNCCYGDGSPIEDSIIEEILEVYRGLEVSFAWQRGDVLMLDNMLSAHARNPYKGERQILVAFGEMISVSDN